MNRKWRIVDSGLLATSKSVIEYLARGVEFAAALIIGLASIEATYKALILFVKRDAPSEQKNEVRMTLGRWLAVALEFELAADILNTAVTPTWNDIEKLVAIATLRRALNYFWNAKYDRNQNPSRSPQSGDSPIPTYQPIEAIETSVLSNDGKNYPTRAGSSRILSDQPTPLSKGHRALPTLSYPLDRRLVKTLPTSAVCRDESQSFTGRGEGGVGPQRWPA